MARAALKPSPLEWTGGLLALLPAAGIAAACFTRGLFPPTWVRLAAALGAAGLIWLWLLARVPAVRWENAARRGAAMTPPAGRLWSWSLAAAYAAIVAVYVVVRHLRFNSGGFDLAIQSQVVWNTAHGRLFAASIEVAHYFGDHVSPLLGMFAPLYWIWESPPALLIVQTLALATCGPAAYRLALHRTGRPWIGLVLGAVVLLLPALGFMNRYDFHAVTFVAPLLLWSIVWAEEGRLWPSRTAALLAVAAREEVGLVVALMALVFWRRRMWGRESLLWAVGGVVWSLAALFVILPYFRGGAESDTLTRYAYLGSSPGEIVTTLATRPLWVVGQVFSREWRLIYPLQLLLPFAGRPLLRPWLLLPLLPPLAYNLLSANLSQASIYFQYTATLFPFLVWAAADSLPQGGRADRSGDQDRAERESFHKRGMAPVAGEEDGGAAAR
ncbi:MAG: DUF2079 domain-containing protein, partial [Candidatus Eisenbacteria bacterium]|nr:DUF2079 domain-containing protein [Candidatus Eisenbacteria bacterium]